MIQPPKLEILIATRNRGKIREIRKMLHSLPVRLRSLDEFAEVSAVEEIGVSYEENASLKALSYAKQTGVCALADDSGLEVEALGGAPGVFSARFGGDHLSDSERNAKLLTALSDYCESKRAARFVCSMALAGWSLEGQEIESSGPQLLALTRGGCEGFIATDAHGENGFGFDPVFTPTGYHATFADLPNEVKARISHRAHAIAAMRVFLDSWLVCPT